MEISEARNKLQKLELDVLELLSKYEEETKLSISFVAIDNIMELGGNRNINSVKICVNLNK